MSTRQLSTITLYSEVPFDETYKHVVNWHNQNELDTFLDRYPHISEQTSYQNLNKPIRWDTIKTYTINSSQSQARPITATLNALTTFNYIKIHDVDHNGNTRDYYAFITNLEYYNDGCTFIYFSIDNWNTYKFYINWPASHAMVQRGFVEECRRDRSDFSDTFKKVMNNPDEIGGDGCSYLRESDLVAFHPKTNSNNTIFYPDKQVKFVLFTTQPKDAATEPGSYLGLYSQYLYYFIAYNPQNMKLYNIQVNGKNISSHHDTTVAQAYQSLSKVKEFAGSDSLVVDSEIYNYLGIPFTMDESTINFTNDQLLLTEKSTYLVQLGSTGNIFAPETGHIIYTDHNKLNATDGNLFNRLVTFYQNLYGRMVPLKIMGEPFSKLFFTDGKGTNLSLDLLKFTTLATNGITLKRFGSISENGHETYSVDNYNRSATADQSQYVTYENALAIDDAARDVPIVLDNYTMYLNANRNQLANVRANAKMNERLAKQGNLISLQNTNRSLATAQNVNAYQNERGMGMAKFDAATGVIGGAASGLMHGGLVGGLLGGVGGAIRGGIGMYKTAYGNETSATALAMNNATQAQNARANYAFQNAVATNNYEQTIRSQNAMLADTRNHNDQIAHQGSNYLVSYQNGNLSLHYQIFTCQDAIMKNAMLYFKLFGYEVNIFGPIEPWFRVKQTFNYVRTSNCFLSGQLPTYAADTLQTMFDNGVTLWSTDSESINRFAVRDQDSDNLFNSDNPFN